MIYTVAEKKFSDTFKILLNPIVRHEIFARDSFFVI